MVVHQHESNRKVFFQYGVLVAAIVVVSQVGINGGSLGKLAIGTYQNLANVSSLSASVAPNEYNSLAEMFAQKDTELTQREKDLLTREQQLDAKYQAALDANRRLTLYILGGVTLFLVCLVFLNFYFDVKREEERERSLKAENSKLTPQS